MQMQLCNSTALSPGLLPRMHAHRLRADAKLRDAHGASNSFQPNKLQYSPAKWRTTNGRTVVNAILEATASSEQSKTNQGGSSQPLSDVEAQCRMLRLPRGAANCWPGQWQHTSGNSTSSRFAAVPPLHSYLRHAAGAGAGKGGGPPHDDTSAHVRRWPVAYS
jgi:hypothetical protein